MMAEASDGEECPPLFSWKDSGSDLLSGRISGFLVSLCCYSSDILSVFYVFYDHMIKKN